MEYNQKALEAAIQTEKLGHPVYFFAETDTTNDRIRDLAQEGAPEGTLAVADLQTAGRGRRGRPWQAPAGTGVWMSLLLRPNIQPAQASVLTLLAGIALTEAIEELTGLEPAIKWPNDIYCQGRKLTGILTEMSGEMDRINYLVVGIGINANIPLESFPEDIKDKAGSMSGILGHDIDRVVFLQKILTYMENLYVDVLKNGFDWALDQWREYSITLGQLIDVVGVQEKFAGVAEDIDEDGALLVRTDTGLRRVLAGDVSIRPR